VLCEPSSRFLAPLKPSRLGYEVHVAEGRDPDDGRLAPRAFNAAAVREGSPTLTSLPVLFG